MEEIRRGFKVVAVKVHDRSNELVNPSIFGEVATTIEKFVNPSILGEVSIFGEIALMSGARWRTTKTAALGEELTIP